MLVWLVAWVLTEELDCAGFKTPASAIEGSYIDKKCPFTSDVSIRGRIFK